MGEGLAEVVLNLQTLRFYAPERRICLLNLGFEAHLDMVNVLAENGASFQAKSQTKGATPCPASYEKQCRTLAVLPRQGAAWQPGVGTRRRSTVVEKSQDSVVAENVQLWVCQSGLRPSEREFAVDQASTVARIPCHKRSCTSGGCETDVRHTSTAGGLTIGHCKIEHLQQLLLEATEM